MRGFELSEGPSITGFLLDIGCMSKYRTEEIQDCSFFSFFSLFFSSFFLLFLTRLGSRCVSDATIHGQSERGGREGGGGWGVCLCWNSRCRLSTWVLGMEGVFFFLFFFFLSFFFWGGGGGEITGSPTIYAKFHNNYEFNFPKI